MKEENKRFSHLKTILKGNAEEIDPEKPMQEQIQHLPYDSSKWEIPRNRIVLGNYFTFIE